MEFNEMPAVNSPQLRACTRQRQLFGVRQPHKWRISFHQVEKSALERQSSFDMLQQGCKRLRSVPNLRHRKPQMSLEQIECEQAAQWQRDGHPGKDFLARVGLGALAKLEWHIRPSSSSVHLLREFITNFDQDKQTTEVRGQQIVLDANLVSRSLGLANEGIVDHNTVELGVPKQLLQEGAFELWKGWDHRLLKDASLIPCFCVMAEVVDMSKMASQFTSGNFMGLLAAAFSGKTVNWAKAVQLRIRDVLRKNEALSRPGAAAVIVHLITCALSDNKSRSSSMSNAGDNKSRSNSMDNAAVDPMGKVAASNNNGSSSCCTVEIDEDVARKLAQAEAEIAKVKDEKLQLLKKLEQAEERTKKAEQRAKKEQERFKSTFGAIAKIIK